MTELTVETVRFVAAAAYGLAFVGTLIGVTRVPARLRTYCYPLASVVGLAALVVVLQEFGIGQVPVGAGELDLVAIFRNLVTYPVLYGGIAMLGGASRRLGAAVGGVALVPIMTSYLAPAVGVGVLQLGVLAALFLPYPVLVYLYLRPVWRAAEDVSPRRRLLHWKARNIVLFLYAVVLLYVLLLLVGLLADGVLATALFEYPVFVFQAVVPGYLIYKFARMDREEATRLFERSPGVAGLAGTSDRAG